MTFTVQTDDRATYAGNTYDYTLTAVLENWPATDMVEAMSTVEFLDPCDNLLTFMATDQTGV